MPQPSQIISKITVAVYTDELSLHDVCGQAQYYYGCHRHLSCFARSYPNLWLRHGQHVGHTMDTRIPNTLNPKPLTASSFETCSRYAKVKQGVKSQHLTPCVCAWGLGFEKKWAHLKMPFCSLLGEASAPNTFSHTMRPK